VRGEGHEHQGDGHEGERMMAAHGQDRESVKGAEIAVRPRIHPPVTDGPGPMHARVARPVFVRGPLVPTVQRE
jgi:hypothetical protein